MHLRRKCNLLFLDGMSYKYQLNVSGLLCHLKLGLPYYYYYFNDYSVFILFILLMAVLGLRSCARAFSSCGKRGPLFITVRGPLTIAASPVVEHRLQTRRLSNCGLWALERRLISCGAWA